MDRAVRERWETRDEAIVDAATERPVDGAVDAELDVVGLESELLHRDMEPRE
jgi:hypothetical protein